LAAPTPILANIFLNIFFLLQNALTIYTKYTVYKFQLTKKELNFLSSFCCFKAPVLKNPAPAAVTSFAAMTFFTTAVMSAVMTATVVTIVMPSIMVTAVMTATVVTIVMPSIVVTAVMSAVVTAMIATVTPAMMTFFMT
ncbi:hypothetical protein U5A85_17675, partial [Priestia megaterium]